MPLAERQKLLDEIGTHVGAPVLALVTGDRPGQETKIAPDQIPLVPRHLSSIGEVDRIALLIYTRGGDTNVAWPIINFIRGHCKELDALIPFHAHSSGTLLTLGANRVYMTRFGTLSPIDPDVANPFNPQDPANPQARIPIAVEDVMAYFQLAERHGVKRDEDMAAAFKRLAEAVHPLALGNVQRSIEQIRQIAKKLIALHDPDREAEEVKELIHRLTTAFFTHYHLINRVEAKEIGLPIEDTSDDLEKALLAYYEQLCDDLKLREKFEPAGLLTQAQSGQGAQPQVQVDLERGYIETKDTCDAYVTKGVISMQQAQIQLPPGAPPQLQGALPQMATLEITKEGWDQLA